MAKRKRRAFTDAYKAETVRLIRESGKSVTPPLAARPAPGASAPGAGDPGIRSGGTTLAVSPEGVGGGARGRWSARKARRGER